jgi:16S rRNA (guanine(966)-N(2))-methyltransferase RsmD
MRIIAGQFRSRRLKGTPPAGIRPTSDKLRETLFNVLGARIEGAAFLDGYAGTGAIGIEAISRGARFVYFVDQSRKSIAMIRENLSSLGVDDGFRILNTELPKAIELCEREGAVFDIAFLDPPYDREDLYNEGLELFGSRPVMQDGILVIEHSKRLAMPESTGALEKFRSIIHGDSGLAFYRKI